MTIAYKGADLDAMAVQLGMSVTSGSPLSRADRINLLHAMMLGDLAGQAMALSVALTTLAGAVQAQVTADGQSLALIASADNLMAAAEQAVAAAMAKLAPQA